MPSDLERLSRAIARGCNLDPDAESPKAKAAGHSIPEWMFFVPAVRALLLELRNPSEGMVEAGRMAGDRCNTMWPCAGSGEHSCDAYAEFDGARDVLEAMIDHILGEDQG